jgi:hypothetical protein
VTDDPGQPFDKQPFEAPAAIGCPECEEVIAVTIIGWSRLWWDGGGWKFSAQVDQDHDPTQPVWDHMLIEHGPKP